MNWKGLVNDFKKFILRGNVVDLAVAVVIGAAFGAVVTSMVKDLVTPLIGIIAKQDFSGLSFSVRGSTFNYGSFINALVSFLLIAATVFFLIVKPLHAFTDRMGREQRAVTATPAKRACPECLSEIPVAARRCAFCTSSVAPA